MNLNRLLSAGGPFIDLRSPAEFASGAVPGAHNLPLLDDAERHQVGLTFKQRGQAAAIALAENLVGGEIRASRIASWQCFAAAHPDCWLYCWRGGLRSETAQSWLRASGLDLPRVEGGFKALRRQCLTVLEQAPGARPWLILGGRTGTGKTVLLNRISASIDLEGLANHRGSAFGSALTPQPTPINFENSLAVAYLQHQSAGVLLEDESRTIGRLGLPAPWHGAMQQAPLVILEADLQTRAQHIAREYVWQPLAAGMAASTLEIRLQAALERISRRLGDLRRAEVSVSLKQGFEHGEHERWIERLLSWYYDPMYDYQLQDKLDRVIFRGNPTDTEQFLLNSELLNDHDHAGARHSS